MQLPRPFGAEESVSRDAIERNRPSIFDKCLRYTQADDTKALGIYPYFRADRDRAGH